MIRLIMPRDMAQLANLAERMHKEGRYKKRSFNKNKLINGFLYLMNTGLLVGFVDEKDKKIVGAVVGYVDTYFFGDDYLLSDRGFYVLPEHRKSKTGAKLLKAYIEAGKKIGVSEICMETSSMDNPDALDLLYKKVGLEKVGSVYKMEIK